MESLCIAQGTYSPRGSLAQVVCTLALKQSLFTLFRHLGAKVITGWVHGGTQKTQNRKWVFTLTYQNLLFCRAPINSILGFIIGTYKKVGFGSLR